MKEFFKKKQRLGAKNTKVWQGFSFDSDSLLWRVKMPFIFKRQMDLGSRF